MPSLPLSLLFSAHPGEERIRVVPVRLGWEAWFLPIIQMLCLQAGGGWVSTYLKRGKGLATVE
ncbi:hypothetical protein HanPSC8_Chr05g0187791 [Helianthus annuus]|nr:hypothetical protein HanPSC8_Chr05g0187791 [Helianthus annuus]